MGSGFAKKKKAFAEALAEMEERVKKTVVEGVSGNGLVTITMNGDHQVEKVQIKRDCIDPEDPEGLQDLIKAAFNDGAEKLKKSCMPSGLGDGFPDLSSFGF